METDRLNTLPEPAGIIIVICIVVFLVVRDVIGKPYYGDYKRFKDRK